ncbi:MAG: DUF6781 family protein [Bacillota bacterium]
MVLQESKRLEQKVRKVAFGRPVARGDVRAAVRDLAITALRTRMLTIANVAAVAEAIGQGIDPGRADLKESRQAPARQAFEGLYLALGQALLALEIALREYAAIGGHLPASEADAAAASLDQLAGMLTRASRDRVPALAEALARQVAQLRRQLEAARDEEATEGASVVGLLASGALLGLIEPRRGLPTVP